MNSSQMLVLGVAVLTLTGCSAPEPVIPAAKSEPEKPAVPVTAKTAFWEMYKPAYAWSADILPLTVEAKTVEGIKNEEGKAAMWQATFGSPGKKEYSTFTYSVVAKPPDIRKGVMAAGAVPWAGPRPDAMVFVNSDFAVDSDEAYKTAVAKAGDWIAKHPGKPLKISLGAASNFHGPVWTFLWGDKKDGFLALVSATSGKILK